MPELVRRMLAEQWQHWFPAEVLATAVLPRQATLALLHTLERAKETYEGIDAAKTAAAATFATLVANNKKRRIA